VSLEDIRARADAATAGPWQPYFTTHGDPYVVDHTGWLTRQIAQLSTAPEDYGRANAIFIAHARSDVPALLTIAEAAAELVEARHVYYDGPPPHLASLDEAKAAVERIHAAEDALAAAVRAVTGGAG
jgi:hypothetical protein